MNLERRENENRLDYIKRIVYGKLKDKTIDNDFTELAPLVFGKEYSSDVARRMFYGVRFVLEVLEEEGVNSISDDELLKKTEEKIKELEKLKVQYQDQKREYRAYLRADSRFEHLLSVILEEMDRLKDTNPLVRYNNIFDKSFNNEAVLICSDWHTGAKFNNYFDTYNYEIEKARVNDLLNKTIQYCKDNKVRTLHLELLGDMLSGAIHISSKVEAEEDVVSQLMFLLDLLEDFINELANNIENIKVYSGIGNHSRIYDFDKNQEGENFERLIPYSLARRFKNVDNVEIMTDCNIDDHIVIFNVMGTNIIGVHGDLDKPNKVVDDMIKMLKTIPEEVHLAHYHEDLERTEYDIELVVNGCLQGTDSYAKRIRKSGRPMQKLRIYNEDGCLLEYKIKL